MDKKQSAVNWLKYELEFNYGERNHLHIDWESFDIAIAEARVMERDLMIGLIEFMKENNSTDKSVEDLYEEFVNGKDLVDEGPKYDGAGFTENDR